MCGVAGAGDSIGGAVGAAGAGDPIGSGGAVGVAGVGDSVESSFGDWGNSTVPPSRLEAMECNPDCLLICINITMCVTSKYSTCSKKVSSYTTLEQVL